ncbi:DUF3459 domain-containing protein, partial [candidate division KSB1 bacterium]|nr:DUF3459 domain-containing protein [candidate division KSB1 bacterium]NIR68443.1 DUF3459 domain-containing protein [candidate division KSB1 bacterium]NIS23537.1 DUF3459 domain-containing protein [candidate division KSB1 bacterium]NIT70018.1 DUF3459 domain-containing protein [candidate division KSB1 bacterium]NIU23655.1 DUF3459 domain-containing protein [candidate division KSB1 bacterium]
AVWYQIFPERFHNGDSSNDPKVEDIKGSWPHDVNSPYKTSNWTGDWYAYQEWEDPAKDLNYHIQRRRYGGDLQGVLDKLDYLQDLGINAIYFNPLFEAPSLHKYDGATYHHIDKNFGPDPGKDKKIIASEVPEDPGTWKLTTADSLFLKLVQECHGRGIKVIIDGVFNHVGLNFWAFKDIKKHQQDSEFASWFSVKSWDDPATPEDEFDYEGWYGVKELPELREDENGIVSGPRKYIFSAVRRWMDPNGDGNPADGIDGWRLDVAEMVKKPFWRDFRKFVRGINPEAYLVGEVWWEDWQNNKMFNARLWLEGDIFDAVMNYRWAEEVIHFFVDEKNKITASQFDARLKALRNDYPKEVNYVLMNLLDSHDTDRLASQIVNPNDVYDHRDHPRENSDYEIRKPTDDEIRLQKLIALFQMTYVGAPMIYYGDEAGMWGADDPDCRKPMLWPELTYEPEASHPLGGQRPVDQNRFNQDLFNHYKRLIHTRNTHAALQIGKIETLLTDDDNDVFAFRRFDDTQTLIIAINNSEDQQSISVPVPQIEQKDSWTDILTQKSYEVREESLNLLLPGTSGVILK